MTNQEWLQQNNAKIKEIKETLAKKVIMIQTGTKTVEIELPEIFNSGWDVYYYQVNKDVILLSASASVGIWIYHVKDNTLKQGYTADYGWKNYTQITDNLVFIGTSSSPGNTVVYDAETDEITLTGDSYVNTILAHRVDDNRFLVWGSSSSVKGISVFDIRTKKSTKIYNEGYGWNCVEVGESLLMSCTYDSSAGVVTYNKSTDSIGKIYDTGRWNNLIVIEDECFISSSYMNGLLLYNDTDKTISTLTSTGSNWKYIYKVDDIIFVSNGSSSYKGLFIVNNDTLTSIYEDGYMYQYFHKIKDRILISGTTQWSLIYNILDSSVVKITPNITGNNLSYSTVVGDRMLLTSNSSSSSYLYIYYYDTNELKASSALGSFTKYDIFVLDGQNCYISSSVKDYINIKYYEYDSNSVKLVGAKVEVKL